MSVVVALRGRTIRKATIRWTSRSKDYEKAGVDRILDPWLYCRASGCIVGRASAVLFSGKYCELVEPVWMSVTVKCHIPFDHGNRLLREEPAGLRELGPVRAFLAGGNRDTWPCWWRKGQAPDDVVEAAARGNAFGKVHSQSSRRGFLDTRY
jgi:hypothetical protein